MRHPIQRKSVPNLGLEATNSFHLHLAGLRHQQHRTVRRGHAEMVKQKKEILGTRPGSNIANWAGSSTFR